MKLLFVCSKNKWRSLTAEKIFDGLNGHSVKSAGTEPGARVKITAGLIGWADLIYVMEKKHLRRINEKYGEEIKDKTVICLNLQDHYTFMDKDLITILEERVKIDEII